jgi:amino-acid N-acetyltransferase
MVKFRKAKMHDVEDIYALVNNYANQGLMLPRSRNTIYESIREFLVVEEDQKVVGCAALHIVWKDLAEIRSIAVNPSYTGHGFGRKLVEILLEEAKQVGIYKVIALTYVPEFFSKCGFRSASKDALPQKIWKECIECPKFPDCDEVAMIIQLKTEDETGIQSA